MAQKSETLTRAISGAVFVLILLFCINYNQYSLFSLFLIINFIATNEFLNIVNQKHAINKLWGNFLSTSLFGLLASLSLGFLSAPYYSLIWVYFVLILLFLVVLLFKLEKSPIEKFSVTLIPLFYVAIPFSALVYIGTIQEGVYNGNYITLFFIGIWANDTFAYLSGKQFGKTKLFEKISPKKTWEGSIGGAICAVLLIVLLNVYFFENQLNIIQWSVLTLVIIVFGSIGDLIESMFKRYLKIKDSGNLMPGHGGALDRFDSAIFAAPFVVAVLVLFKLFV